MMTMIKTMMVMIMVMRRWIMRMMGMMMMRKEGGCKSSVVG